MQYVLNVAILTQGWGPKAKYNNTACWARGMACARRMQLQPSVRVYKEKGATRLREMCVWGSLVLLNVEMRNGFEKRV